MKHNIKHLPAIIVAMAIVAGACSARHGDIHSGNDPATADSTSTVPDSLWLDRTVIEKELLYDKYTLADTYPYKDTVRIFQWVKIRESLARLDSIQSQPSRWGILQNRHNKNGEAPPVRNFTRNAYRNIQDAYGVERRQGIPLYLSPDSLVPERYGRDGALVKLLTPCEDSLVSVEAVYAGGKWTVPGNYIHRIEGDTVRFSRVIFVDRTNQNIATLERSDGKWLVRSMNPATTGLHRPPYQQETPLGIFVIQGKKTKMYYYADGTTTIEGFAPYASRFCNGGYIHGVPVNYPRRTMIEYSWSLGTTPRSHMCVRNATSHAQFIFDWAGVDRSLVFVIE